MLPGLPGDLGADQDRPVGAIGQQVQHRQPQVGLDPPQQRRAGVRRGAPVLPVTEVPVGDQQPVFFQVRVQGAGQRLLPAALGGHRPDRRIDLRVRGALADRHHPHLGKRRRRIILAGAREPERGDVLRRGRGVPLEPVHAHQPPRPQERPRRVLVRDRDRDLREQLLHRLMAQPLPGLGDPARRRDRPRVIPAAPLPQRLGQLDDDLLVVIVGEQRQRHDEIHHHVRRQLPPGSLRALARRLDRVIDRIPRHPGRQHAQGDRVGQTAASHQTSLRHKPRSCRLPAETPGNDTPGTPRSTQAKWHCVVAGFVAFTGVLLTVIETRRATDKTLTETRRATDLTHMREL